MDNVLFAYGNELAYDGRLLRKTNLKPNTEDFTTSKFDFLKHYYHEIPVYVLFM